jgi:hypothetical protein
MGIGGGSCTPPLPAHPRGGVGGAGTHMRGQTGSSSTTGGLQADVVISGPWRGTQGGARGREGTERNPLQENPSGTSDLGLHPVV